MIDKFTLKKIVVVYWSDAASSDGWDSIESYLEHTPIVCRTAGFLLTSTKNYVTIASTESTHGQLNQAMSIPRTWIHKMIEVPDLLKEPKNKAIQSNSQNGNLGIAKQFLKGNLKGGPFVIKKTTKKKLDK